MSQTTSIEWTDATWNPTTGCDKVSQGCKNCYAVSISKRLNAMGKDKYRNVFELTIHPPTLNIPYGWKKPRVIFVNSMSDLFHKDVPLEYIQKVFHTMNHTPRHTYQILTKRAERLYEIQDQLNWTKNIWMGVSVENEDVLERIDYLRYTNAHLKFLSVEPLLGPLKGMNLENIDWVIVGGESGPKARPMEEEWVQGVLNQCTEQEIAFFFKQWGGKNKKAAGRLLNGRTYDEMPDEVLARINTDLINLKIDNNDIQ